MRSLGVVLTMYQMKTPARRSTMAVKATDSPGLSPFMIARRNATTPIASRNPMMIPTNMIVMTLVLTNALLRKAITTHYRNSDGHPGFKAFAYGNRDVPCG